MSKKKDSFKPWLSRPTVNRSVTLPLTRPLTQRLSNLNEFHPNELDPYLLFDAQDSMIGTLENPTLDLDPSKPDTLNVITATRAGTATYTDFNGNIASAPANTVRVDHVDGVPMILVEPSSENLVTYSTPDTNWPLNGASRIEDFAISPDASQTATKITKVGTDTNERTRFDDIALVNGTEYSASVYLKNVDVQGHTTLGVRVTGGTLFRIKIDWTTNTVFNDNGTTSDRFVYDVGDGWYRIGFSFTANGTNSDFEVDVERNTSYATDTSSVLVWGAQVETGSVATSLIPTSGGDAAARTRAADDLSILGSQFTNFFNSGGDGTFYAEFITRTITEEQVYVLAGHSSVQRYMYSNTSDANLKSFDGYSSNFGGDIQTTLNRASISYDSNTKTRSLNGSTDLTSVGAGVLRDSTRLAIGQSWSSTKQLNGHIKRLIYWPYHSDSL